MKFRVGLTPIIAAVTGIGCSSTTAPSPTVTTYALVSINGAALPFTEPSTNSRIVSGSIALIGTDSARVNDMTQPLDPNGNPVAVGHVGFDHVTRAGSTLVLLPLTSFAAVDTATLQGSQLIVRHHATTAPDTPIEIQLYVAQ